jgi:FKBP-type peptidyl-prolyl cis-trans isomerase
VRSIVYHRIYRLLLLVPLAAICIQSCRNAPGEENAPRLTAEEEKEMLLRINKFLVRKDIDLIESYAKRRGWDMEVTETGLFYEIYEQTEGRQAKEGMVIRLDYRLSLLDGTLCYSAEKDGFKEFRLGKGQEISGLEQGVEMMREGEKARLIIPPHLAYGLLGDEIRIPARSIIIYEIELLEAKQ